MASNAKPNTPLTTPLVWDVHMAKRSSKSGLILILLPCLRERWAPAHITLRWMTAGVVGIGRKCSDWVSATPVPSVISILTLCRFLARDEPRESGGSEIKTAQGSRRLHHDIPLRDSAGVEGHGQQMANGFLKAQPICFKRARYVFDRGLAAVSHVCFISIKTC
jgi:hypothetical protein